MRRSLLFSACFLFFLSIAGSLKAQTDLNLGDIAFTGFNADGATDQFSFVILRNGGIDAGTTIRFTDRGWNTGACGTNGWAATAEGEVLWTATSALAYGAQVRISSDLTASTGTVTGTPFSFTTTGDQIFAVQNNSGSTDITGAHDMLAGLHMNVEPGTDAAGWDNQVPSTAAMSNRPTCILNGSHGLFISPEVDNARIRSSVVLSGSPATDRSRINNAANWETNDGTPFTLPGSLSGLPVDFAWIKASEKGGRIQVEWGVAGEEQIKNYIVERSFDGRLFTEVGTVVASGRKSYSWSDAQPNGNTNYYRVRATEISEHVKYSTIAIVNLSKAGKGIGVYPNIVRSSQFSLQVTNMPAGNYKLNLHNATGQLVYSRTIAHAGGSAVQTINLPAAMQKGVYRMNMFTSTDNAVAAIIIE